MSQGKRVPDEIRWRVLHLYQTGLSGHRIGRRLNLAPEIIYRIIRAASKET